MEDLMIKIDNVSKQYRLGQISGGTLQGDLQSWWAKKRGKEDPNSKIGTKTYGKNETFLALDGVSFEVKRGERVGIIGHNGAGKSTLLKLLSRVTAPTKGEIGLNGRVASMLEVGTGFHGELTGRENIYMNGAILGMTKKEIDAKMEDIIEFSECRQFIDTPVKRYSSGMYVKLAFSVAAHLDSEILIMDEVLAVGDMAFQKKCLDKMNDVSRTEGRTILYVSHNMNTIRQLCDRVVVLDHGHLIFDGDVESGINAYMGANDDKRTSYDFKLSEHRPKENQAFLMTGLVFADRKTNVIVSGDIVNVIIHCFSKKQLHNVRFRVEIYFSDNTIAGTMFSDKSVSASAGDEFDLYFEIPTKNFAPGNYRCIALAYVENGYGSQTYLDRVDPAMFFEIINNESDQLTWLHQYWGHTRFDDMVLKIKTNIDNHN